jgi:signal transduction histidine kinase
VRSIQSRLSLGLLLSLIIVFTAQWLLVSHGVRVLAEHYISERLMHDAEGMLRAINIDAQGKPGLDPSVTTPVFQQPFSGHYYRITVGEQVLRSRSLWDQDLPIPPASTADEMTRFIPGPQETTLLLWDRQFHKQGQTIHIAVAEDFSPVEADLQDFQTGYAFASLFALALLVGVQAFFVRRGLHPLKQTRHDLSRLERGEIHSLDEQVPREISPLVSELNRLLDTLRQRLQRSRNALGNLTHAMKTPLTHIQQLAHGKELDTLPEIRQRLLEQSSQLQQLIERELTRARLAGHSLPGQRLDVAAEISALTQSLSSIYREKSLEIEQQVALTQAVTMDREDFLELMGNLLDNASKWARHNIKLSINDADGLRITIEDDGPGCAEEQLQNLTQRGVRIDETTTGHGLGLAIVQDIVESYQGSIDFDHSPSLGGLRVQIRLAT